MVERWGFEDLACGVKRVSVTWVREGTRKKKQKNISLLACLRMRQWWRWDLQGLRGDAWWRGGGLRTQHVGKEGSPMVRKETKKEEKKHNFTCMPVSAGNGSGGCGG